MIESTTRISRDLGSDALSQMEGSKAFRGPKTRPQRLQLETEQLVQNVLRDALNGIMLAIRQRITPETKDSSVALKGYLERNLKADRDGNINEEQMYHGLVSFELQKKNLLSQFNTHYERYAKSAGARTSFEEGTNKSLQALERDGLISRSERDAISKAAFRGAQLDENKTALHDSIGGANDPTRSVMKKSDAITRAIQNLAAGESSPPEATTPPSPSGKASLSGGFLWKPISDSDRKLVVLTPATISKEVVSVALHRALPPSNSNLIETGEFSGIANGDRAHFRFKKQGRSYADGLTVVVTLKSGEVLTQKINDASRRFEK